LAGPLSSGFWNYMQPGRAAIYRTSV